PVHVSGSSAFVTAAHAPVPVTHVWHAPAHAAVQHTPSSHAPERQSSPAVHSEPGAPGVQISLLPRLKPAVPNPPKRRTSPVARCAAANRVRANVSGGCGLHACDAAFQISTVPSGPLRSPPATITSPDERTTAWGED